MQAQRNLLPLNKARELYPGIPKPATVHMLRHKRRYLNVFKRFSGRIWVDVDELLREVDKEDLQ